MRKAWQRSILYIMVTKKQKERIQEELRLDIEEALTSLLPFIFVNKDIIFIMNPSRDQSID